MKTCDRITAAIRGDLCRKCPTPCEHQGDAAWRSAACVRCPLARPRFGYYGACTEPAAPESIRGLGDVVAMGAQPVARLIDRVIGTNLANCGGCKARQAALNKKIPFA